MIHVEDINIDFFVGSSMCPGLILENLDIADAVDLENTVFEFLSVITHDQAVLGFDIVGLYNTVSDFAAVRGCVVVKYYALFLTACVLQQRDCGRLALLGEDLAGDKLQANCLRHLP